LKQAIIEKVFPEVETLEEEVEREFNQRWYQKHGPGIAISASFAIFHSHLTLVVGQAVHLHKKLPVAAAESAQPQNRTTPC
jgi:hypothetical protein